MQRISYGSLDMHVLAVFIKTGSIFERGVAQLRVEEFALVAVRAASPLNITICNEAFTYFRVIKITNTIFFPRDPMLAASLLKKFAIRFLRGCTDGTCLRLGTEDSISGSTVSL